MRAFRLAATAAAMLALGGCVSGGQKEIAGTLLGAVGGGLAGSQVGKGSGQLAAVGVGTLLGAMIGGEIGRSLDKADKLYAAQTAQATLETAPTGATNEWVNPDSGHSGTYTPTNTYQTASGQYCREFQQTITIGGQTEEAYGRACRQEDGSWQIVDG